MPEIANVAIHSSQFPDAVRRDLIASLRERRVNHKFHYDSVKQTQKWLALHQAYSPSRHDSDCASIYDDAFAVAAAKIKSSAVHLIGLGCGGGQKDTRLLKLLRAPGRKLFYTPCDVSAAMTLVARATALAVVSKDNCFPFVCDLSTSRELSDICGSRFTRRVSRLFTFFGMIPNFEPQDILPKLAGLIRANDILLFSANLAPGNNYSAGMKQILPQYDNALTRDWLMTFPLDLGIERKDGEMRFAIELGAPGLKRVVARFHFKRSRSIEIDAEDFSFRHGDSIRLFFSYRYTPEKVCAVLARHGLAVRERWVAKSGEEGVFLCVRAQR
jgi:L-histidine N-alpha-methyltransferase